MICPGHRPQVFFSMCFTGHLSNSWVHTVYIYILYKFYMIHYIHIMYIVHEVHAQRQLFCHVNTCTVYYIYNMHLPRFWSVGAGQCHQKSVYRLVSRILWIYHDIQYKICSCLLLHPLARSHWGFPFAFIDEMPSRTDRTSTCRYRLRLIQNLYHDLFAFS